MKLNLALSALLFLAAFSCDASGLAIHRSATIGSKTRQQLSIQWWQWAMSAPEEINPLRDTTGANCSTGQAGPVWFLAGGFDSSKIHRTCVVPSGKSLFFPVINMVYYPKQAATSLTCKDAKDSARLNNETAVDLFVELDGVQMQDVKKYRVATKKCFNVFAKIPKADHAYDAYPSASDGYWIFLNPLSKGIHVLRFGGRYNQSSSADGLMAQDIEYEIEVR